MGNDMDFCKCDSQDMVTQVNVLKEATIKDKSNSQTNEEIILKTSPKRSKKKKILNNINASLLLIKKNIAAKKITNFFKEIKIKKEFRLLFMSKEKPKTVQSEDIKKESSIENYKQISSNKKDSIEFIVDFNNKPSYFLGSKTKLHSREGLGIKTWYDTTSKDKLLCRYVGEFINDKAEGYGKFEIINKSTYEGYFVNNKASGFGTYRLSDNSSYIGLWLDDHQDEIGIEKWEDNSLYEGEYLQGKKHGVGTYTWPNGAQYSGEWVSNKISGYGILKSGDQIFYGEFENNMKNGIGTIVNKGSKFCGNFTNDKKNGFGIFFWDKDEYKAYIGFWKNGKKVGFGKFLTQKKEKICYVDSNENIEWLNHSFPLKLLFEEAGLERFWKFFNFSISEIQYFFNRFLKKK